MSGGSGSSLRISATRGMGWTPDYKPTDYEPQTRANSAGPGSPTEQSGEPSTRPCARYSAMDQLPLTPSWHRTPPTQAPRESETTSTPSSPAPPTWCDSSAVHPQPPHAGFPLEAAGT